MENGQGSLSGLQASLAAMKGQALIRAAVETARRAVWYIDAVVAPPAEPSGWRPLVWEYESVTFIAAQTPARALAAALNNDDAQILPLGRYDLTLPVLAEQLPWQHRPSRARYDSVLLPWPTLICEPWVPNRPQAQQRPPGYLIGDECRPSRPTRPRSVPSSMETSHVRQATRCHRDSGRSG